MANNFDEFPLYDPIINFRTGTLSDQWVGSVSTFYQTLISYLTQNGIFLPPLTTDQRDDLQSPQEGQMIYTTNDTVGPPRSAALQVWQVKAGVGAWRTITTVP